MKRSQAELDAQIREQVWRIQELEDTVRSLRVELDKEKARTTPTDEAVLAERRAMNALLEQQRRYDQREREDLRARFVRQHERQLKILAKLRELLADMPRRKTIPADDLRQMMRQGSN